MLSGRVFVGACAIAALAIVAAGRISPMPVGLLAAEVLATILGMFVFWNRRSEDCRWARRTLVNSEREAR